MAYETLVQVFSIEFCENFKNIFFTEHLLTTASILRDLILQWCDSQMLNGDPPFLEISEKIFFEKTRLLVFIFIIFRYIFDHG